MNVCRFGNKQTHLHLLRYSRSYVKFYFTCMNFYSAHKRFLSWGNCTIWRQTFDQFSFSENSC